MAFLPRDFSAKQLRGASIQGIAKGAKLRGAGKDERPAGVAVPRDRYKSELEREFAAHLEILRAAGELLSWDYECIRIRLADKTWYTADFLVHLKNGSLLIYETKGFMREAARVRVNVASTHVPIPIFVVTKEGGAWRYSLKPGQ